MKELVVEHSSGLEEPPEASAPRLTQLSRAQLRAGRGERERRERERWERERRERERRERGTLSVARGASAPVVEAASATDEGASGEELLMERSSGSEEPLGTPVASSGPGAVCGHVDTLSNFIEPSGNN